MESKYDIWFCDKNKHNAKIDLDSVYVTNDFASQNNIVSTEISSAAIRELSLKKYAHFEEEQLFTN